MNSLRDIAGDLGPLYDMGKPTIPMFSFDRPALLLWQGAYDALRAGACTDEQATQWLQSKGPRMILDGEFGEQLRELGREIGRRCSAAAKADHSAVR